MNFRHITRKSLYLLLLLGIIFSLFASRFPQWIEAYYSTKTYYWIIRPYSRLMGLFPFSLAEFIVVTSILIMTYIVLKAVINFYRNRNEFIQAFPKKVVRLVLTLSILYLFFNLMWGLNYSRMTFAEISGFPVGLFSVEDVAELALYLTDRANELREQVAEDSRGVMTLSDGIRNTFARAQLGFDRAGEIYPELGGRYGTPKTVMLSHYWSYTGITGAFFPFTAEANVNVDIPDFVIPSVTSHEMAHQRGFAREDEANYIAYLTSVLHPDVDFQYSGVMLALTHTMNTLYTYDPETWRAIKNKYSEKVKRDLIERQEYWASYEGPVEKLSTRVNDTYLKVNRQEGVQSYGRMVDLLLAEFKLGLLTR